MNVKAVSMIRVSDAPGFTGIPDVVPATGLAPMQVRAR
jgi:hypothetical protein